MLTSLKSALALTSLSLAGALALVGCVADATGSGDTGALEDEATEEPIGAAAQAVSNDWTPWTSDEYPPIACDSGSLIGSVQCFGRYCDDIRMVCKTEGVSTINHSPRPAPAGAFGATRWLPYFSDETAGQSVCSDDEWATGIACKGRYCDDVSLQCTKVAGVVRGNCQWTGWISDESEPLDLAPGTYVAGAKCSGSYCDNMRFFVCQKAQ